MKTNTHNGFILKYAGTLFPASRSNAITYNGFCFMGGLANERLQKIERRNGNHVYYTYHRCDK